MVPGNNMTRRARSDLAWLAMFVRMQCSSGRGEHPGLGFEVRKGTQRMMNALIRHGYAVAFLRG